MLQVVVHSGKSYVEGHGGHGGMGGREGRGSISSFGEGGAHFIVSMHTPWGSVATSAF